MDNENKKNRPDLESLVSLKEEQPKQEWRTRLWLWSNWCWDSLRPEILSAWGDQTMSTLSIYENETWRTYVTCLHNVYYPNDAHKQVVHSTICTELYKPFVRGFADHSASPWVLVSASWSQKTTTEQRRSHRLLTMDKSDPFCGHNAACHWNDELDHLSICHMNGTIYIGFNQHWKNTTRMRVAYLGNPSCSHSKMSLV